MSESIPVGGTAMAKNNVSVGILLIAIAAILVLGKLGVFGFLAKLFWPLIVMAAGLLLHYFYFRGSLPEGVLVPGGMLITYSLMFLYGNVFGWDSMRYLWPGFLFGIAVGLYEWTTLGKGPVPRGAYSAALVLAVASAVLFVLALLKTNVYLLALLLVAAGAFFLVRRRRA
jgi:hypothetical protein